MPTRGVYGIHDVIFNKTEGVARGFKILTSEFLVYTPSMQYAW